ncbi:hypothetical protein acdb102_40150 [Acidothermaceae bacterium B102]|nr:hypothetical protein acdb102_40150 [Acidothermaceae bacterium B102]
MLALIAVALLLGGLAVLGRWWLHRVDAIGRKVALPWSAWMLPVMAGLVAIPVVRHHTEETRLSHVASVIAGVKATVHCQSGTAEWVDAGPELGYVKWGDNGVPEHSTLIKHAQCGLLSSYLNGGRGNASLDEIVAVHVLTHESMHMHGITNEALADCAAMQRDATTAELLGATPTQALWLARTYWVSVYPNMPDAYRTGDCKPGGTLDEHLSSPPW